MRVVSRVIVVIGVLGLLAAVIYWAVQGWEVYRQYLALDAMRSREFANPLPQLALASGLGVVAGLVLGLGLSLPIGRQPKRPAPGEPVTRPEPPAGAAHP